MKVFGIGLARTGTTSLHHAFSQLGLRSAPSSVALLPLLDDPDAPSDHLERYDAFTDNPVPFLFDALHRRYPDARFILSTRPLDEWLGSMQWLFGAGLDRLDAPTRTLGDAVHQRLYGITEFDAETLTDVYHDHHDRVRDHFVETPGQLLTLPLGAFRWHELCRFVGIGPPRTPFPFANTATPPTKQRWHRRRR